MSAGASTGDTPRLGDRRTLARTLTWLEAGDPRGRAADTGTREQDWAYVVGVTGSPGAGKSTLTNEFVRLLRHSGQTVAVLAIDPSGPFSGGALLGDRIRMSEHQHDPGVYIRSMATRGQLGGLALAVPASLRVMSACGFDVLIVETVGVGQIEVDIAQQADTTLVVINPGWGDHVQASKAGLLEIADIFAVNKADRAGADDTAAELNYALDFAAPNRWRPPVERCVAETGEGVEKVWAAVQSHRHHVTSTGQLDRQRRSRRIEELRIAVREVAARRAERQLQAPDAAAVIDSVAAGDIDVVDAAHLLLDGDQAGGAGTRQGCTTAT
jgi:LAO/AO transport system kinase